MTDGPHGYHVVDEDSPVIMLTAKNARGWFSEEDGAEPIHQSTHLANQRSSLKENDIILSTRGTVGLCALVTSEVLPANIDQDVARIAPSKDCAFLPEFLLAYLNSTFGQDHIKRNSTGMVQQGLSLSKVRQIPIPQIGSDAQKAIASTVTKALELRREVKAKRAESEQTLLQALGLENWSPPEPLSYTRKASEVWEAGRLDAEYFPPIYDALFDKIRAGKFARLGDCLTEPLRRGISPDYDEDGEVLVINSQHVAKDQVILDGNRRAKHPALGVKGGVAASRNGLVRKGDVLMNSTGYITIGRCHCLLEDVTAVVDNHVAIIRPKAELDPVYLACFLNGLPGKLQTERGFTGSSGQIELRPDVIADYLVWVAPWETQMAIRDAVESSHAARATAAELLERAKRAVEIAIEQSEAAALAYLEG